MLNKRLVRAVPESRKYIAGNVLCQWVSLLANIRLMAALTALVAALLQGYRRKNVIGNSMKNSQNTPIIRYL